MNKYKVLAEAIVSGKLAKVEVPTSRVDNRRLSVDEIKKYIAEEFGKAKAAADVKAKEVEKGWGDAEIAKEIEWVKALDLCEYFDAKKKPKKKVSEGPSTKKSSAPYGMTHAMRKASRGGTLALGGHGSLATSEPSQPHPTDQKAYVSSAPNGNDDENTYYGSAAGQKIDRMRAEKELDKHGVKKGTPEYQDFEKEFGGQSQIDAQALLRYLGY